MIQLVILTNGDRILAEVRSLKKELKLTNPMRYEIRQINGHGTAVVLTSYVQYATKKPIKIAKSFVLSTVDVEETLKVYYNNVCSYNESKIQPAMEQSLNYVNDQMSRAVYNSPEYDDFERTLDRIGLDYPSQTRH